MERLPPPRVFTFDQPTVPCGKNSLVSFGVSLYVATETKSQISLHQISRSTGERVRHQKVLQSVVDSGSEQAG